MALTKEQWIQFSWVLATIWANEFHNTDGALVELYRGWNRYFAQDFFHSDLH